MAKGQDIQIIEYRNGKPMHIYGLQECASNYHCHTELIKGLIYTGQAFPYSTESITFDIHPKSPYHIEEAQMNQNKRDKSRYYMYDIVKDKDTDHGQLTFFDGLDEE